MVNQQEFHYALLRLDRLLAIGAHNHAGTDRCGTGRQRLRRLFHLDETHAAVRRNRQFLVIAKMRNIRADLVGSVHHHAAFLHFYLFAVNFNFNHGVCLSILSS